MPFFIAKPHNPSRIEDDDDDDAKKLSVHHSIRIEIRMEDITINSIARTRV